MNASSTASSLVAQSRLEARDLEISQKNIDWDSQRLEKVFAACFLKEYATKLIGGADEPLYQAAGLNNDYHQIFYRFDYFSSALHEVAHWCIAGKERRQLEDYGYWYEPDGRSHDQQLAFQKVEVKPQAIEMAFSIACGKAFSVSVDNLSLNGEQTLSESDSKMDELAFANAVTQQYRRYCKEGFPMRAQQFIEALTKEFSLNKSDTLVRQNCHHHYDSSEMSA